MIVLDVLHYEKAMDSMLATCTCNIWLLTVLLNIILVVSHIQVHRNYVAGVSPRRNYNSNNQEKLRQFIPYPFWMNTYIAFILLKSGFEALVSSFSK